MEYMTGDEGPALGQAQAILHLMEQTPAKENLSNSLQLLKRNAMLIQEIRGLSSATGDEAAYRAKMILEVNANIFELCRSYQVFTIDR